MICSCKVPVWFFILNLAFSNPLTLHGAVPGGVWDGDQSPPRWSSSSMPPAAPTEPHCLPPLPPLLGAASQGLTLLTAPEGTPTHEYSVPGCAVHPQAGVSTLGQGPADRQRQGLAWRTKHLSPCNPARWTHPWMATATTGLGVQAAGPLGKGWPEGRGWKWEGAAILPWPGKCGPLVR